jgi:predicted Zn-dependent protease
MLAQAGGLGLGVALGGAGSAAGSAIMQGYSLGTQLGILLPYSRSQEHEADHIGVILMAKAGYDPAQALEFWKRMMAGEKGAKLPQFMSTHPNDASRLESWPSSPKPGIPPPPAAQARPCLDPHPRSSGPRRPGAGSGP